MAEEQQQGRERGGLLAFLRKPSTRIGAGTLLGLGVLGGFVLVALGAYGMAYTNTMEFCVSCHTMKNTVYVEYQESIHYHNASGVQVGCPDCHVPQAFGPLMVAKVLAVADIYHEIVGSIDTQEKFESRRWMMANKVWNRLESTDSGTCRSCHDYGTMAYDEQDRLARRKHKAAAEEGKTCIECHKGITHKMPDEPDKTQARSSAGTVTGRG